MSDTTSQQQIETDKKFIQMADLFINQANEQCADADPQLVNASMLYASARFSAFITASLSESKENYEKGTDQAIEFFVEEFRKMLKEHMRQYKVVLDKKTKNEN